jgi:hypothetical protein
VKRRQKERRKVYDNINNTTPKNMDICADSLVQGDIVGEWYG